MYIVSDAQAVAYRTLTSAQLTPLAVQESNMNSHPLQNFCMMSYGTEYPFGQSKLAVLILFPPWSSTGKPG